MQFEVLGRATATTTMRQFKQGAQRFRAERISSYSGVSCSPTSLTSAAAAAAALFTWFCFVLCSALLWSMASHSVVQLLGSVPFRFVLLPSLLCSICVFMLRFMHAQVLLLLGHNRRINDFDCGLTWGSCSVGGVVSRQTAAGYQVATA